VLVTEGRRAFLPFDLQARAGSAVRQFWRRSAAAVNEIPTLNLPVWRALRACPCGARIL